MLNPLVKSRNKPTQTSLLSSVLYTSSRKLTNAVLVDLPLRKPC
jgi:hypothetical protein